MPRYKTKQADIFYLDPYPGNSQVVLLLHGLGTEGSSWQYQTRALGESGFRPIAPDMPGFGQSGFAGGRWTIKSTAMMMADLIQSLNVEKFHVVGISMGGTVALQTAIDFPLRIQSLTLLNTFATLRPKRVGELYYLIKRYVRARIRGVGSQAELTARRIFPKPEQELLRQEIVRHIRQTDPDVYKRAMLELGNFDARKSLKHLQMQVLVLSGENDTTVAVENQNELAAGITHAQQLVIQNAGHGMIVDQPQAVNAHLIHFLKRNSI